MLATLVYVASEGRSFRGMKSISMAGFGGWAVTEDIWTSFDPEFNKNKLSALGSSAKHI